MDIKEFSQKYRVRTKRDSCGEEIITGTRLPKDMPKRVEYACHVYDQGDGQRFGVLLLLKTKQQWTHAKKQLVASGFTIKQNGDTEGTALFNSEDAAQVRLAFKLARIRVRRELSPERRQALTAQLSASRQALILASSPVAEASLTPNTNERPAGEPVGAKPGLVAA